MLLSMTGYSTLSLEVPIKKGYVGSITIEIKALNSRFFELTTRLSRSLGFLETDLHSLLRKRLVRGRIYCSVQPTNGESDFGFIVPAIDTAKGYLNAANKMQSQLKVPGELSISDIALLPNIFESEKVNITEANKKEIIKLIEMAADKVNKMRAIEGEQLKKDIVKRISICSKSLSQISTAYERLMKLHKKLIADTAKLAEQGDERAASKLEDLYAMLNKIDIHEEIVRFQSHLKAMTSLLKREMIEKGKRLDFTLQELVRETNTIAAKCSNADISSLAVDIKVELEKIREQSQNVL